MSVLEHREARARLSDLAAGRLDEPELGELQAHVAGCAVCQGWLEAHALIAGVLREEPGPIWEDHPTADRLAQYSVAERRLSEHERRRLSRHLVACADCRTAVELSREAVAAAAPPAASGRGQGWPAAWLPPPLRLPLAAAALLALLLVPLALIGVRQGRADQTVSGKTFYGREAISARRSLTLEDTRIQSGASVTLEAGEVVMLGNGFSVDVDASFTAEVIPDRRPADLRR